MKKLGLLTGAAVIFCLAACLIAPASAAATDDNSCFGYFADEVEALAAQGYDTTELSAALETAQAACKAGDADAAKEAILEFRSLLRAAVSNGDLGEGVLDRIRLQTRSSIQAMMCDGDQTTCEEALLQFRIHTESRIQAAVENGTMTREQMLQHSEMLNARIRNACACGGCTGDQVQAMSRLAESGANGNQMNGTGQASSSGKGTGSSNKAGN